MTETKTRMNRRNFLSRGLPGIAGTIALAHLESMGTACKRVEEGKKHKMVYRTLGKTGIKLPIVSMGTMDATSEALTRTALDAGISHIATAQYYARGRVEEFIGKIIKNYKREKIILATGVIPQPIDYRSGVFSKDTDIAKFEKDFEGSLKRLDVDYVDFFYLAFAAKKESVMFEPLMKSMEKMKKSGKTRFLGVSSHSFVSEAVRAAADSGFYDVVMLAYNFQIKDIEERKQAVAYAAKKGMGIVAMKTITGESWMVHDKQVAASNPKAALKWVLQNDNIHTAVPGFTTFDQLETNLSVMEDLTLTPEEKQYLELARINHKDSLFCQGCGTCLKQCPSAPDIPTLMRCYMYAYGYRDLAAAVRNIESVKDDPIACADCSSCVVKCPMGFDIKGKVLDIIRLRNFPPEFIA
ncbi:MAG: aldo/keto reductase [Candidatus Aminicenantes bacterium]|nr:aldo/keto reductase [Candidatus Aminicenantes bacterium]MDH5706789.1 aldo/keto reductase [Candidatus Aminicenantes bacterium]